MTEQEKKIKVDRAAEKVKRAKAEYRKAVREEKDKERKAQDHHKFIKEEIIGRIKRIKTDTIKLTNIRF